LGIFLAAMGIIFFWNINYTGESHFYLKQLISVSLIFSVPLIDTTTVFIKRLLKKKSPFIGGKDHTTHHLSYLGLSDRQVAFIVIGICVISIFLNVIVLHYIRAWSMTHFLLFALYFLTLFVTLFTIALKSKSKPK
jgi:UDP-GlcNAc:undecaprenyl-phosphate/decaprenyl-phosphate GlcNAc-1-phosphate transferase